MKFFAALFAVAALTSLAYVTGCQSVNPDTGKVELRPPTAAEIRAWDNVLKTVVSNIRATVARAPEGPNRTKILAIIDAGVTWENLGGLIFEAAAAGFEVPATVTPPPGMN